MNTRLGKWLLAWLVVLTLAVPACAERRPAVFTSEELRAALHEKVRVWVARDELARPDGFTYAVDIGQLLVYAAKVKDRELYGLLHGRAERFIIDKPDDDFTRGFVAWREKAGTPLDASGTTEALRMAEGLWEGAAAFAIPADSERALLILHGYARHATTDHGIWLIRNYFNLGTRGYATNSFLVDYDPDFVHRAGEATGDKVLLDVATRSYALVRQAVAPSGLLYDIVQPEVLTLMPDFSSPAFSPNDVVQLSNSCTVAERCATGAPEVGRGVLRFARERLTNLNTYYLGRSGGVADDRRQQPGPETYAGLVRLAVRLGDAAAVVAFQKPLLAEGKRFLDKPGEPRLYTAGEILSALEMVNHTAKP